MIGTITFQQKHKLWPSSCPPRAVNLLWHEPFQGATVTRPQTPTKPHRLLNSTSAAVFVHLLKMELSTCKGHPGQSQSLDQRQSSLISAGVPAMVRQRPSSSAGARGQGNQGETQQQVPGDTAWWELPPLVCLRSCCIPVSQGANGWETVQVFTSGSNTSTAW